MLLSLLLRLDPLTLIWVLDRSRPQPGALTAHAATVLEGPGFLENQSDSMVSEAVARSQAALSAVDIDEHLDQRRSRAALGIIAAAVLLPMLLVLVAPGMSRLWAARMFMGSNAPWPQKTYLEVAGVEDGVLVVPRGEMVVLRADARAGSIAPEQVAIRYREGQAAGSVDGNMTAFGANDFRYDFASISAPTEVRMWGGDDEYGPFTIRPADRPRIVELKLISQHPTDGEAADGA